MRLTQSSLRSVHFEARLIKFDKHMRMIGRSNNMEEVDGELYEDLSNGIFNFPFVSRKQAILEYYNGRFYIQNVSSSNVTEVNGIKLGCGRVKINNGDVLRIGHNSQALVAGIHLHYPEYNSIVPDSISQQAHKMDEQKKKKYQKKEEEEIDQKKKEEEEEENKEEEDTQTIQELIAQLSSNPNKSEEEEAKIAGLVKAQNKMIELGVTTKQAIKLVPELWKF